MEYAYAVLLLSETDTELNEENITRVLTAAEADVSESRVKAMVAALENVDVHSIVDTAINTENTDSEVAIETDDSSEDQPRLESEGDESDDEDHPELEAGEPNDESGSSTPFFGDDSESESESDDNETNSSGDVKENIGKNTDDDDFESH